MTCKYLAQRLEKQQEMAKEFLQELCLHLLRAALKIFDHIVARTKHTKRILSQQSQSDIRFPVCLSFFKIPRQQQNGKEAACSFKVGSNFMSMCSRKLCYCTRA